MKEKLVKIFVFCFAMVCICTALCINPVFAATTSMNGYIFVPVKNGSDAAALFTNTTGDGADATITTEANGNVELGFAGLGAGEERTRTDVSINMDCVKNHSMRYVKFDMTADSLMDLVLTMDDYNATSAPGNRPHSLFLQDTGYLTVAQHSPKVKYDTKTSADGYKSAISGEWWINAGHTIGFEAENKYNVVFILDSNIASTSENDTVSVYVNGKRLGQMDTKEYLNAFWNNKLDIHHYATSTSTQNLLFENVEVGWCTKTYDKVENTLDANATEWTIPDGKRTFLRLTVPTNSESAYHIATDTGDRISFQWFKDFGMLGNWNQGAFNSDGTAKDYSYDTIKGWSNINVWKNTSEVTLTIEVDKVFNSLRIYTDRGDSRKVYGNLPTKVILTNKVGDTKPTSVQSGTVIYKGSEFVNETGESKNSITAGDKVFAKALGKADKNEQLQVIYAYYDLNNNLISATPKSISADENGFFVLTQADGVGGTVPDRTKIMKVFVWKNISNKPVIKSLSVEDPNLFEARILGRYEKKEDGYSLNWVNSGVEFTFTGTEAKAKFGKVTGRNYFTPYIDGVAQDRIYIDNPGVYTIAENLENTNHTVKFVRSSEARDGRTWVSSIEANNVAPTGKKDRFIEFYGDSYSAGYGNMGIKTSSITWGDAENSDAQKAFPALVANNFNADLNVIAFSGKGMVRNGVADEGLTVSEMSGYSEIVVNGDTTMPSTWNFDQNIPDLVVIFLGTNDSGYKDITSEEYITGYSSFITQTRERYGNDVKILCVDKPNGAFATDTSNLVNELKATDNNISFYQFNEFGGSSIYGHPNISEAEASATELNTVIAELMDWN